MRNKTGVIILTVSITLLCIYYLSFTFQARGVQQKAEEYARNPKTGVVSNSKKQKYFDSVDNQVVYKLPWASYDYKEVKQKELSLGLDLQGGMHVVVEVSPIEIIKALSGSSASVKLNRSLQEAQKAQANSQEKFIFLFQKAFDKLYPNDKLADIFASSANREKIRTNSTNDEVIAFIGKEVDEGIDRAFEILRRRIDKFGVANPNIQKLPGSGRIMIELPGVDNPERVRKLISGVAKLEFWELYELNEIALSFSQLNQYMTKLEKAAQKTTGDSTKTETKVDTAKKTDDNLLVAGDTTAQETDSTENSLVAGGTKTDSSKTDSANTKKDTAKKADTAKKKDVKKDTTQQIGSKFARLFKNNGRNYAALVKDTAEINSYLRRPEVRRMFKGNALFFWDVKPDANGLLSLHIAKNTRGGKAPLEGDVVVDARQEFDQNSQPEVSMRMNQLGTNEWKKLTRANVGRRVAIVLDGNVYSAPTVQNEIPSGNSSISGSFSIEEAKDLANILKAGKLPAPVRIVEEAIVGPSLGQKSINQGLQSMLVGLGLVVVFMILYYKLGGAIANVALLANIFFIVGILAQFGAVLTLPGIAGIVLTIGMSVDANVLIYERIREELRREQAVKLPMAIKLGYEKAYSSIIDANVTTFLIGAILYSFGSGGVKGFAVTLMIGIACSLFSAIFITRLIIEAISRGGKRNIGFSSFIPTMGKANIQFIKLRKKAYMGSAAFITCGIIAMVINGGLNLGVDFKGGRSYVVKFEKSVAATDARQALTDSFKGGLEVKTFGASNQIKVTTSYLIDDESQEADKKVKAMVLNGLKKFNDGKAPSVESSSKVGSTIADDIRNTAQTAVLFSLVVIFIYIVVRFRRWQYGAGAIAALFHDVLFVLSAFSIAHLLGFTLEIDQVFIAAILTVIGYSINDTVVVFDRIREEDEDNTKGHRGQAFSEVLNNAINNTLSRTVMTSTTTLVVVLTLFLAGGEVLRGFSFALLIGVLVGTYSSVFIASPVVLDFYNMQQKKDKKKVTEAAK
ncbi:protein translocase subunit SecDF [Microscilla marina]|uniref:protein translocase subunit SecDF n=1 Tax=Microscilla marina TaxID=1027 RepID=UPI0005D4811F|nr:protein translocase subunit SecDF [Microscilla marina]